MIVDAHTHLFPSGMDKVGSAEMLLREMDAHGVEKAVVLGIYPRVRNEFIAEQAQTHPDRFIGFASVDPKEGQEAVALLNTCVRDLAVKGLKLHPDMQGFRADDLDLLTPLMRTAETWGIPVLLHSWGWFGEQGSSSPIRVMALARAFPAVTFIMAHCGGLRFMDLLPMGRLRSLGQLNNLYVDLAIILDELEGGPMWPFLRWTLQRIGWDRVLAGSDFPDYTLADTQRLVRSLDLAEEDEALVTGGNAALLFGLSSALSPGEAWT
jgi:predicted TIM-barrel fold metal-dependent hydrolase